MEPEDDIKLEQMNVALLKQLLLKQKTFQPRFSLPLTIDDANELLMTAVMVEVGARGNDFHPSQQLTNIIREVAAWCIDKKKVGLMLCGLPGNGKTTIMKAIRQVFNLFEFRDDYGEEAVMKWVSAMDVARLAKTDNRAYQKLCHTPMLAIDDFGEEPAEVLEYGNILSPITDMLSIRYADRHMTIVTTNTAASDIRKRYGARIADRFNEMMQVIIFTQTSYRGKL